MTCYHPLKGYQSRWKTALGKRQIVFNKSAGFLDKEMTVPCGQCIGCRLERSRQWAIRITHEASLYEKNCFITLTYSDEYLPFDNSLHLEHFQKFMKRFRKKFGQKIRFYHCGEYGSKYGRPHYHACIFNFDFNDKKLLKYVNNNPLYTSASLEQLWRYGYSSSAALTFHSAAYVARYIMKKVNGARADEHYERFDDETGEFYKIQPEYTTMSRRPGIGKDWFDRYKLDIYSANKDFVFMNNKKMRPPRFYDSCYEVENPNHFAKLKSRRKKESKKHLDNQTPERLTVREKVKLSQIKRLVRTLD